MCPVLKKADKKYKMQNTKYKIQKTLISLYLYTFIPVIPSNQQPVNQNASGFVETHGCVSFCPDKNFFKRKSRLDMYVDRKWNVGKSF
jgi:hypothetical protein